MRTVKAGMEVGKNVALLDFQLVGEDSKANADLFFRRFASWVAEQLNLPDAVEKFWNPAYASPQNCTRYREQHVLEPLGGYLELARRLCADASAYSGSWNFGPSPASIQTVESVVTRLAKHWQGSLNWAIDGGSHPHEAGRLLLDSSKAAHDLGWRARLTFEETIGITADWYAAARGEGSDLRRLTEAQIDSYAGKAPSC